MADAVLSFVIDQLAISLREESALLGGLRDEVQHIKDELGQMKGFLRRSEEIVANNSDLKEWIGQVRDVAYDAEDILEEFLLRFGVHCGDGFLSRARRLVCSIMNLKARRQTAIKIRAVKERTKNIAETHQRYQSQFGIFDQGSSSTVNRNTWYDSRGDALLLEEADLVGIERPKKKLMDMLFVSDSRLRVISVVGMGGLGKTTLVKKVYDDPKVKSQFRLHIWIAVSQLFNIETLLKQVVTQVRKEQNQLPPDELGSMDIHSLKQFVRDLLHQKKYVLVFDDIWRTIDWDALRMAFPRNNCGSRIVITTRITEVGQVAMTDIAGAIYKLEHLTKHESWALFCKKVFQATSCPQHLKDISENILRRCDGLPLAIVVMGGILATKSRRTDEWDLFNRSIGRQLTSNDQLENMMKLPSLSYYDLPDHLRICFLYLSILPEDVSIQKSRLIRLWIAEGFVQRKEGVTMEEVAEAYLNELISRSLVQVSRGGSDGQIRECRLHDIIQQFILNKVGEHNITTISSEQGMQSSDKVRRLVIHSAFGNQQVSNGLPKCIRSLVLFESSSAMSEAFPSEVLLGLSLLNVLELRDASLETIPEEIYRLLHLKYLGLRRTNVKIVSKLIGNLQRLETLDLKYTHVTELPNEILKLQQLRHLLVGYKSGGVQAPCKIGRLKCLQSLRNIDADEMGGIKIVKEISCLTQLRKLGITKLRREDGREFCSSLEKLINLRSLSVRSINEEEVNDVDYPLSSAPQFLRHLQLWRPMKKAPQWISSLYGLTNIHLGGSQLKDDPLQLLQDLPNLMVLGLEQAYKGEGLFFNAGGFRKLKSLEMTSLKELRWVTVEKGAMPILEELSVMSCCSLEDLPTGIEHLTKLRKLLLSQMSGRFEKTLEDRYRHGLGRKKIDRIPQFLIGNFVGDKLEERNFWSSGRR